MRGSNALLVVLVAGFASSAHAAQVTVGASQDNTVFSESGTLSNGAGQHFFCGQTDQGHTRRALLRFEVASAIPSGLTVTGAQLTLYLSRTKTNTLSIALHPVLASWGESTSDASGEEGAGAPAALGDATWTHRFYNTDAWLSAGSDFAGAASAATMVANQSGYYSWSSPDMIADVQAWLDSPSSNFGWALVASVNGNKQTKRFDSPPTDR